MGTIVTLVGKEGLKPDWMQENNSGTNANGLGPAAATVSVSNSEGETEVVICREKALAEIGPERHAEEGS